MRSEEPFDAMFGRGQSALDSGSRLGNVSGALLLGGRSTRMGRDKARIVWQGRAWSTRIAQLLDRLCEEVLLVGGDPEATAPGRRVADPKGPGCALRGLVGALESATAERVLVVATDLPFVNAELLLALTAWPEADAVVPIDARGAHPLCAIYRREACLGVARSHLASQQLSLRALLDSVATDRVSIEDLGLAGTGRDPMTNINTPEDLARLEGP
jgi:molybdopterin-guanine dinucleotide biosynthesis protein A